MAENSEEWLEKIKSCGYRLTQSRKAVVRTLIGASRALTPSELYSSAREIYPALGLVSVYRALEKLEQLELIQRVHQEKGCQAYMPIGKGHQHMLICRGCGKVVFFEGDQLEGLFSAITSRTGFRIDGHWLQVSGVCSTCRSRKDEAQ